MHSKATQWWLLAFGTFEMIIGFSFTGWRYWYRYPNFSQEMISNRILRGKDVETNYGFLPLTFGALAIVFGQAQILAAEKLETHPSQRAVAYLYGLRVVICIIAGVLAGYLDPASHGVGPFSVLIFYIFMHVVYSLGLFHLRKQLNRTKQRHTRLLCESALERMHRGPDEYLNGTMAYGGTMHNF